MTETQTLIFVLFALALLTALAYFFIAGFFRSPFVPSSRATVRAMLAAANLQSGERLCDLGCGDGRIIFAAEKMGARAIGYEISIFVWLLAQIRRLLQRSQVQIFRRNFFHADFRNIDVVTCYLLPEVMVKLSPKLKKELRSGARIVSAAFHLPGWPLQKKLKSGKTKIFVYQKK